MKEFFADKAHNYAILAAVSVGVAFEHFMPGVVLYFILCFALQILREVDTHGH